MSARWVTDCPMCHELTPEIFIPSLFLISQEKDTVLTCRACARCACGLQTAPLRLDKDRPEYHRASARWDAAAGALVAESTGGQISSRLLSCRSANLLLELPRAEGALPAGTVVGALVIGAAPLSRALSLTSE